VSRTRATAGGTWSAWGDEMTPAGANGPSNLWTAFSRTAAQVPDKVAVTSSDGTTSFREVERQSERLAAFLNESGIGEHAVVHVALPNVPAFLPVLLALRRLNATVGLVSSRYRDAEFRAVTDRMRPTAYLTTSQLAGVLNRSIDVHETRAVPVFADPSAFSLVFPSSRPLGGGGEGKDATPPMERHCDRGLALVKFTSGSTGAPKGVGLTEANLLAEAANTVATLGITSSDRILVPVPVSHSYGFDLALLPLIVAGAEVVMRRSFIPMEVLTDLSHSATSVFLGVPSMYRILLGADPADVPDLSHVRYLLSCTAPLLPSLVAQCKERLGVPVCQHYGSSETGAIATHRPGDVLRHPGSVGVAMENVAVRIVGEDGVTLQTGEEGEIVVRSEAVAAGYATDELATSSDAFTRVDDHLTEYRTGDVGVIDEEGFIFWRGRRDQVINVGGLKVYPSEVVQVLERCPAVSGARVVASRDPGGEEVVHAVVTLSQSVREQDIQAYCRQHLADYKVPRRIEIVESIAMPDAQKMSNLSGDS
jgi:long-chain acyl-CoA synthetase